MLGEYDSTILERDGTLEYIKFKNLLKYKDIITHCFTTRNGGVSSNECSTLNMGFKKNDKQENVEENYKIISNSLKINYRNMVFSNQVHDNKIKIVDENDRGKGITKVSDILGYDGLITNVEEVALVTFFADCVPIFLFDPVKRVIALSHSGWRGTVKEIAKETVKIMKSEYACNPSDIEAAIGPAIGSCCFEVNKEVYEAFEKNIPYALQYCESYVNNKWYFDLKSIIMHTLNISGVNKENICISNLCTKCNNDMFFSYRGDNGKTGSLAAIMQINAFNKGDI